MSFIKKRALRYLGLNISFNFNSDKVLYFESLRLSWHKKSMATQMVKYDS